MRVIIANNYEEMPVWGANYVAQHILDFHPTEDRPFPKGMTAPSKVSMYVC